MNANQGVVDFSLSGGSFGLRLVNVAATNNVPRSGSFRLALLNAQVNGAPIGNVFPPLSFRCSVSQSSFPNTTVLTGTSSTRLNLAGVITRSDIAQPVNLLVVPWAQSTLGSTLVCSVYQDTSTMSSFYARPDNSLGIITVRFSDFSAANPNATNFGVPYTTPNFKVTLGPCNTCPSGTSASSTLSASLFLLLASLSLLSLL